jgi:hypothetical protein
MSFDVGNVLPDQFPGVPQRLSGPLSFHVRVTAWALPSGATVRISENKQIDLPDITVLLPRAKTSNADSLAPTGEACKFHLYHL